MSTQHLTKQQYNAMCKASEELHSGDRDFKRTMNYEFAMFFIIVLGIALAIRLLLFSPVQVSGPSMTPTLLDGERMLVTKTDYWFNEPQRGDIIICYYPNASQTCVKRVIALPGETIEIYGGIIFINDEPLDESAYWSDYVNSTVWPITVPEDCVFVIGDNRNDSLDSRSLDVGPIPYCRIVGKVQSVVLPLANARRM